MVGNNCKILNSRSKTIKLGKWWVIIVKYILPIFILIVWIGGMMDVIKSSTFEQLVFTVISAAVLLIGTLVLTILPAKNPDWENYEERI